MCRWEGWREELGITSALFGVFRCSGSLSPPETLATSIKNYTKNITIDAVPSLCRLHWNQPDINPIHPIVPV